MADEYTKADRALSLFSSFFLSLVYFPIYIQTKIKSSSAANLREVLAGLLNRAGGGLHLHDPGRLLGVRGSPRQASHAAPLLRAPRDQLPALPLLTVLSLCTVKKVRMKETEDNGGEGEWVSAHAAGSLRRCRRSPAATTPPLPRR